MELNGKKILFIGDSITEGVGVSHIDKVYWNLVAQKTGATCIGYGIGGTRIARQYAVEDNDFSAKHFVTRLPEMEKEADAVVVFGGTNDFGHGDAPLGTMADRTVDTFYGGMHALCTALINQYPTAQLVVMTPTHRNSEDEIGLNERGLRRVAPLKRYVEIIKEVAEYYSIPVLDLYAVSGIQPKVPVIQERYMPDGLHPNDAGHEKLADKLISFFETL